MASAVMATTCVSVQSKFHDIFCVHYEVCGKKYETEKLHSEIQSMQYFVSTFYNS
jgi:hypothetical protein